MEYLSKQRYDEILAELNHLIDVVYPEVRDQIAETSAQGDRSENAGYREARRRQAKTISRIRFLQKVLDNSRVIDPNALPKDIVCLLSKVEFTNLATNARMKFEIVSPHEMDLEAGKISLKSPIGAALMGKRVGDIAEAQTPSGTLRLRIESIALDSDCLFGRFHMNADGCFRTKLFFKTFLDFGRYCMGVFQAYIAVHA